MWNGYLRLGGNEIVNTPRVVALASSLGLPLGIECDECPGLADMAGAVYGDAEAFGDVTTAPWYDANDPASEDFIGFVGLKIRDALDSTREAPVFQRLGDGGVLGRERHRTREVRVTGLLIGRDRLSIDYGMNWLSSALGRNSCGQHGMTCGLADLEWLADCPAAQGAETDPDYAATVAPLRRFVHDVGTTSGPLLLEERETDCFQIYEIEFTITAQEPKVLGAAKDFELTPAYLDGVSESVQNLIRNPSIEASGGVVGTGVAVTNYVGNPSLETNSTSWASRVEDLEGNDLTEYSTIGITRILSPETAASGEYVGFCSGRVEVPTDVTVRAGFYTITPSAGLEDRASLVGTSFRAGISLSSPVLLGLGVRFDMLDQNIEVLSSVTYFPDREDSSGLTDLLLPESIVAAPDWAVFRIFVFHELTLTANEDTAITAALFDAAWVMEG